ncbi:hypothetical protein M2164_000023 [Streptomyces sp. SAI-208]|nr:hypothetical protein [Streptomyces sp. SAI-208]
MINRPSAPADGPEAPGGGTYVPDPPAARTPPWTLPPVHGRALFAAAPRPGEK